MSHCGWVTGLVCSGQCTNSSTRSRRVYSLPWGMTTRLFPNDSAEDLFSRQPDTWQYYCTVCLDGDGTGYKPKYLGRQIIQRFSWRFWREVEKVLMNSNGSSLANDAFLPASAALPACGVDCGLFCRCLSVCLFPLVTVVSRAPFVNHLAYSWEPKETWIKWMRVHVGATWRVYDWITRPSWWCGL